ncbi:MAG: ribonuclease P protein component [Bacteroidia bacterium]|nr:ribonuclease P protein component [Bacteroidia bacterium]
MKYRLRRRDKLKSRKLAEQVFNEGKAINSFPLKLIYLVKEPENDSNLKMGCSVSKRLFKKAVNRNKIKRLIRESYRSNKPLIFNNITTQCAFMILYIGKSMPSYYEIHKSMTPLLKKLKQEIEP